MKLWSIGVLELWSIEVLDKRLPVGVETMHIAHALLSAPIEPKWKFSNGLQCYHGEMLHFGSLNGRMQKHS